MTSSDDELGKYIDERIAALRVGITAESLEALCKAVREHERASIVENLLKEVVGIKKNGEGLSEPQFHWLAAERTEMIAEQIRRGVL